jgi:hypothetical protein
MILQAALLLAGILPPSFDDWKRTAEVPAEAPLPKVAREYGLREGDGAVYENGKKKFQLAAFRLKDVTGAVAFEQSLQDQGKVFRHLNYVFLTVEGTAPRGAIDAFLFPTLPKIDRSANPNLLAYLPAKGRVRLSERFILGPESLRAFEPRIPVAAAGFDFAGELQMARYDLPGEPANLIVFRYPNHAIARQQFEALKRSSDGIPSAAITRQGPLVAMALPAQPGAILKLDSAQALIGQIQYKAEIVMDKKPPKPEPNPGDFLVGVFQLCGILLGLCLGLGLIFAFGRAAIRRVSGKREEEAMTTLGI